MSDLYTNTATEQLFSLQQGNQKELPHLHNPYLKQLLPQLINRHRVVQLFFTPQTTHENARLIVHLQSKHEAGTLQKQKWVTKLHNRHHTFVHVFYSTQLNQEYKIGNPFIFAYCQPAALIYTNKDLENHLLLYPADKKKHRKKYKAYKQQFHHDHELLRAQLFPMLAADCSAAVLLHYENLLNHNLEYLESLYTGTPNTHQTLNERIHNLTKYAPQIQKHFVKKSGNTFHLIDLIEKAKKTSLEAECFFGSEHYKAFEIAEQSVFEMVETRFKMIKKMISKHCHADCFAEERSKMYRSAVMSSLPTEALAKAGVFQSSDNCIEKCIETQSAVTRACPPPAGDFLSTKVERKLYRGAVTLSDFYFDDSRNKNCIEGLVNLVTTTIQKTNPPEEIYQFHHTTHANTQTYYLLLIGKGFSNQLLKDLTNKLQAQTGNKAEFVLIAHTRSWIQEWLYAQQDFFKKIIKEENRIFTTSPYHPKPHWEHPYAPYYPDLELYYKQTVKVFDQLLLMADRLTDNYSGVANLFSLFFQTFCKTYLFATISYYPNNLHSKALWQLCLYANPDLKRYEYLFQELETPFFNFLDHYRTIQHTYPFKQKQKTNILIEIADKLLIELKNKLPRDE
ncbi:MAG: hypothetical protein WDZ45_07700 [Flavobacteriaceae bacterium]